MYYKHYSLHSNIYKNKNKNFIITIISDIREGGKSIIYPFTIQLKTYIIINYV